MKYGDFIRNNGLDVYDDKLRDLLKEGYKNIQGTYSMTESDKKTCSDEYFGGVSFDEVKKLVELHYPEKFI